MINGIYGFFGEYRFLSNFHSSPINFLGLRFPTVENAYQAAKCKDVSLIKEFVDLTPGQAKKLGNKVELHPKWEIMKVPIMTRLSERKYLNPELRDLLLSTEDLYLEETNTWNDRFWGVCNGKGQNVLGNILMKIRDNLNDI